jgi:hypothetical protein
MAKEINKSIRATNEASKKRKRKGASASQEDQAAEGSSSSTFASKRGAVPQDISSKDLKREREAILSGKGRQVEFQKAASRKRLNDIVQAPPTITKAPRGESRSALEDKAKLKALLTGQEVATKSHKLSRLPEPVPKGGLKREAMLREERERVVQAYRRNKQAQLDRHH